MGLIYKIENRINGKIYIGQTIQTLRARFGGHLNSLKASNNHKEGSLYYDMQKYGVTNFDVSVIERCDNNKLSERETYYINKYDSYNNGYNRTNGGSAYFEVTDKVRKEIIEMAQSGMTATEIIATIGYSLTAILNVVKSEGIDINKDSGRGPIRVIQYTQEYKPIRSFESITEAYRNIDSGVSESTFQHNVRRACGTGELLYGYHWAIAESLLEEVEGKLRIFRSPLDRDNYLNGSQYWIKGDTIITDITNQLNKNSVVLCKYCGKPAGNDIGICGECVKLHPKSRLITRENRGVIKQEEKQAYKDTDKKERTTKRKDEHNTSAKDAEPKPTLASRLPDKETLESLIKQYSYAEICRMYGVYERTLRDKLREYGIYKEKINRNADDIQIIRDVLTHGRTEAAKLNNVSTWKVDNILDKYKIPSWLFDNSKPVRALDTFTKTETIFRSFKDAARAISPESATASAINSLGYKIGKAAQEGKVYKGYTWSILDKQAFIGELLLKLGDTN